MTPCGRRSSFIATSPTNEFVGSLRGKRVLRPASETQVAERLKKHQTIVYTNEDASLARERSWPYLAARFDASAPAPASSCRCTQGRRPTARSSPTIQSVPSIRPTCRCSKRLPRAPRSVEHAETLERERKIATTLQQASLPTLIPRPAGIRFDAVYSPAGDEGEVGGDWYDAIELDDGSVVVSVGDVTGRGIQAAAIMSKVRHAMGMAPLHETDPTKILDSAGWFLGKRYPDAIVTAFVAIIDPQRSAIHFANAGHPLPLLWRDGELFELEASGLPLGLRTLARPGQPHQRVA